jgi:hypothetical protein
MKEKWRSSWTYASSFASVDSSCGGIAAECKHREADEAPFGCTIVESSGSFAGVAGLRFDMITSEQSVQMCRGISYQISCLEAVQR